MSCTTHTYSYQGEGLDLMKLVAGDTFKLAGTVRRRLTATTTEPYNLTGCGMSFTVKKQDGTVLYTSTDFTLNADGTFSHVVADETTGTWPPGEYSQRHKIFLANGESYTLSLTPFVVE